MHVVYSLRLQWPGPLLGQLFLLVNYDKNDYDEYPLTSHVITSCMLTADPDTIPHATTSFFPRHTVSPKWGSGLSFVK